MIDQVLLAIDGGGTRTRCLAVTRLGVVIGRAEAGASNDLQVGPGVALASIEQALREALDSGGVSRDRVAAVAAGLAGVDADGTGAGHWTDAFLAMGFPAAFVHGDMIAAHRGALANAPGIVVVAGTGSVVVGIGADGAMVKVGGWGPIYGNEGSAYWIGREGLRAAARAADGRGPQTVLVARLGTRLGVESFTRSIDAVYGRSMGQQEIAALAPEVHAAAEAGDPSAAQVCAAAAADLAEAVIAAVSRLGSAEARTVSYQGGLLLDCPLIRTEFELRLRRPGVLDIRPPRHPPVVGAFLLGCRGLGWDPAPALHRLSAPAGLRAERT